MPKPAILADSHITETPTLYIDNIDSETVGARKLERVYDFPAGADRLIAREQGIRAVVVNGTILRENGDESVSPDGELPGSVLRNGHAAA